MQVRPVVNFCINLCINLIYCTIQSKWNVVSKTLTPKFTFRNAFLCVHPAVFARVFRSRAFLVNPLITSASTVWNNVPSNERLEHRIQLKAGLKAWLSERYWSLRAPLGTSLNRGISTCILIDWGLDLHFYNIVDCYVQPNRPNADMMTYYSHCLQTKISLRVDDGCRPICFVQ